MNWITAIAVVASLAVSAAVVDIAMTSTFLYAALLTAGVTAIYVVGRPLWKP